MIRIITLSAWFVLNVFLNLDYRLSFYLGFLGIICSFLLNILEFQGIGLRLLTYSFGLFFIGTLFYLKYHSKNERSKI